MLHLDVCRKADDILFTNPYVFIADTKKSLEFYLFWSTFFSQFISKNLKMKKTDKLFFES